MSSKFKLSAGLMGLAAASLLAFPIASSAAKASKTHYMNYKGEAPCPVVKNLHDGFYVGVGAGYDNYSVGTRTSFAFSGATVTGNPGVSANGWLGELFAGYGAYFSDMYYLGGEVFVATSGAQQTYSRGLLNNYTNKFTANNSYGIGILPGIKINDSSLLYVRLGYNWASLKGSDTLTVASGATTASSKSSTQSGFNYGLGLESAVYQNWSLRGEYTYTSYNSFTNALGTKWSPSDNQFVLGLIYHFV